MASSLAALSALICLFPLAYYLVKPAADPLNPLRFFGITTFFVTTYRVFTDYERITHLVSDEDLSIFLVVVILSTLGFYFGWRSQKRREARLPALTDAPVVEYRPQVFIIWAFVLSTISATLAIILHNDYTTTGYLIELKSLWVPGGILAIQGVLLFPGALPTFLMISVLFLVQPLDRFFSYGQRGDTFRMALMAVPFFLFRRWRPRRVIFIPLAIALALTLGTIERTRGLVERGDASNRIDALLKVIPSFFAPPDYSSRQMKMLGGNECVFGTAMISTVRHEGSYEYGAFLYNLAIRFTPKEILDKDPFYTRWNVSKYITYVTQSSGFEVTGGAAPTGFAHAFVEFGWASPLLWYLMGWWGRILYRRAVLQNELAFQGYYTAYFVILLYMVTQDLYAAFMNTVYTVPILWVVYHYARVTSPSTERPGINVTQAAAMG